MLASLTLATGLESLQTSLESSVDECAQWGLITWRYSSSPKVTDVGQAWVPMPPEGLRDLTAGSKGLGSTSTHSHLFPNLSHLEGSKREAVDWKTSLALSWSPGPSPWLSWITGCRGARETDCRGGRLPPRLITKGSHLQCSTPISQGCCRVLSSSHFF